MYAVESTTHEKLEYAQWTGEGAFAEFERAEVNAWDTIVRQMNVMHARVVLAGIVLCVWSWDRDDANAGGAGLR